MRHLFTSISALSAIGWVAAQSTSVMNFTMFLKIAHTALSGSIVAIEPGVTSVALQCPSNDTEQLICRPIAHPTFVQGPSTLGVSLTVRETAYDRDNFSVSTTVHQVLSLGCTTQTPELTCWVTAWVYDPRVTTILKSVQTQSTTTTIDPALVTVIPVTITGGLEKLAGATGATDVTAASSTSKAGAPMMTARAVLAGLAAAAVAL